MSGRLPNKQPNPSGTMGIWIFGHPRLATFNSGVAGVFSLLARGLPELTLLPLLLASKVLTRTCFCTHVLPGPSWRECVCCFSRTQQYLFLDWMSSTARTEPLNVNDHDMTSATSASLNTGKAKNEVQHAKQGPTESGRLRLDALTIAGLTGTPHHGGAAAAAAARFFGKAAGTSASPRSPTGSDDTLGSIQDSSVGDEVCLSCALVRILHDALLSVYLVL